MLPAPMTTIGRGADGSGQRWLKSSGHFTCSVIDAREFAMLACVAADPPATRYGLVVVVVVVLELELVPGAGTAAAGAGTTTGGGGLCGWTTTCAGGVCTSVHEKHPVDARQLIELSRITVKR